MCSPAALSDMLTGFQKTQILLTAAQLGVFDDLSDRASSGARALALRLGLCPEPTERLLNACVGLSLLTREGDEYSNSVTAQKMLTSQGVMRPLIDTLGYMYTAWGRLQNSVKDGKNQLPHMMKAFKLEEDAANANVTDSGAESPVTVLETMRRHNDNTCHVTDNQNTKNDVIKRGLDDVTTCGFNDGYYYQNGARQQKFLRCMTMFTTIDGPHMVGAFDLSRFKVICDLGGDFFADDLPPADLYILSHILHNWGENDIHTLLDKIHKAVPKGGAVLLFEKLLQQGRTGPLDVLLLDLSMLLGAAGRERSGREYTALLQRHGFRDVTVRLLPQARFHDAVLATKLE